VAKKMFKESAALPAVLCFAVPRVVLVVLGVQLWVIAGVGGPRGVGGWVDFALLLPLPSLSALLRSERAP